MVSVLWIDDDVARLQHVQTALLDRGISLVFAANAWTGLERLRTEPFDLVIVDGMLDAGAPPDSAEFLDLFAEGEAPLGLTLVHAIKRTPGLIAPRRGFLLCSGMNWSQLCAAHPELTADLHFIPKGVLYHQPRLFIDEVVHALSGAVEPNRAEPATPSADRFEERWHDLRNSILNSIPTLARVSERLSAMAHAKPNLTEAVVRAAVSFAHAAGETIDDLGYKKIDNPALAEAEDRLRLLEEKIKDTSASKITMLTGLVDVIAAALSRLPRTSHSAAVTVAHDHLRILISASEISVILQRLTIAATDAGVIGDSAEGLPVDTSAIVRQLIEMFAVPALQRRIELRSGAVDRGVLLHHGSISDYRRMLTNVIENAVKYNGQLRDTNAWIKFTHQLRDNEIVTIVESWGLPIPKEQLKAVFDPHVRGDNAGLPGRGLGLSIAQLAAQSLGGRVAIEPGEVRRGRATTRVIMAIPSHAPTSP